MKFVPEIPNDLRKMTVYVEHNSKTKENYYAYLRCPCGCKDVLTLNLMDDVSPVWTIIEKNPDFSIKPSIWRKGSCKSHFWIKSNKIIWT